MMMMMMIVMSMTNIMYCYVELRH